MFKIGDKVRVITSGKDGIFGEVREIKQVTKHRIEGEYACLYDIGENTSYGYREVELEKVSESELEKINEDNLAIERVIHQDIATIVFFNDGTKEVVKCQGELYDKEKAIAIAVAKKWINEENIY